MTTLTQLEAGGLQFGDLVRLNSWGAKQLTKVIGQRGYSQILEEGIEGSYLGRNRRSLRGREVLFPLKGLTLTFNIHEGVDYFIT